MCEYLFICFSFLITLTRLPAVVLCFSRLDIAN